MEPASLSHTTLPNTYSGIINKTIICFSRSLSAEILEIAKIIRIEAHKEYVVPQNQKIINDVKFLSMEQVIIGGRPGGRELEIIAKNIYMFISAVPCEASQKELQNNLKSEISYAIAHCLKSQLSLSEIVDLSCLLKFVYSSGDFNDKLSKTIITQYNIEANKTLNRDLCLDVFAAFSLKNRSKTPQLRYFYNKFSENIIANADILTPFQISLVANVYQSANLTDELFTHLKPVIIRHSNFFTVNEIVNTIWAFTYRLKKEDPSLVRERHVDFINVFKDRLVKEMTQLDASQTVRIAWAFDKMNVRDEKIFKAIVAKIDSESTFLTTLVSESRVKELGNITKILCNLGGVGRQLLKKLLVEIEKKCRSPYVTKEAIVSITYDVLIKLCQRGKDFACYDHFISKMITYMYEQDSSKWHKKDWKMIPIICEVHKYLSKINGSKNDKLVKILSQSTPLPDVEPTDNKTKISAFQKDVSKHLNLLFNTTMVDEYLIENYFSIDTAMTDISLAVEVDGMCHFDELGNPMPKDIIKETMLEILQWKLVRISKNEWPPYHLNDSEYDQVKREILLEKFSEYLDILPLKNGRK